MRKKIKKSMAFMMAVMLSASAFGRIVTAEEVTEYPEYLNLESAYPVIKDEYAGTIKLKVAVVQGANGGVWEDLWLSQYMKEKYNVELEVETILDTALADRKGLMFNSGDMPDLMLNMWMSTAELYKYGQEEGMLLPLDTYMNETLTPNIVKCFENNSQVQANCTAPDSHVYTLPWVYDQTDEGKYARIFINTAWLEELGLEMPRTLEEFTEVMYKMKEADPKGVGSENVYPFSGSMNSSNAYSNTFYILNSLGYLTTDAYGLRPTLRDGEVVIPVYDMEVYQEFLKLMNQYYTDGIINPNFFTINDTEVLAQLNGGQSGLFREAVYLVGVESFDEWTACYPLTSEYQTEAEWPLPNFVSIGNFCVSAETEYPELCMRIADLYFKHDTDDGRALWVGVGTTSENSEAYSFGFYSPDVFPEESQLGEQWDTSKLPEGLDSWNYLMEKLVGFMPCWGTIETAASLKKHYSTFGAEYQTEKVYNLANGDGHYRSTVNANLMPYAVETYPEIYYTDAETQETLDELVSVIEPYAKEQIALFITGERPLSETEAFKAELEGLGIGEMLEIYKQIYGA